MSHDLSPVSLVLVHGWAGSADVWEPVIQQFRVAGVDSVRALRLPGSPGAKDQRETTVRAAVRETLCAVSSAPEPIVLVGHSMGAQITLLAHPYLEERLLGEVVIDPAYGAKQGQRSSHEEWSLRIDRDGHAAVRGFFQSALVGLAKEDAARILSDLEATSPRVIADYLRSEYVDDDAVGLERATRASAAIRTAPVLAIHSQTSGRDFEATLDNPPGSEIHFWEGHGHFLHLEDPEKFVRSVIDFIAGQQD